jgi:hypothetical protein
MMHHLSPQQLFRMFQEMARNWPPAQKISLPNMRASQKLMQMQVAPLHQHFAQATVWKKQIAMHRMFITCWTSWPLLLFPTAHTVNAALRFPRQMAPVSFLQEAPWIAQGWTELPISVEACWDILLNDASLAHHFSGVTVLEHQRGTSIALGAERSVRLDGLVMVYERFDVFEDDDNERCFSFCFIAATVPNFVCVSQAREECRCEASAETNATTSIFTATTAVKPGWLPRWLGYPISRSSLQNSFQGAATRMLEAVEAGLLPLS